MKRTQATAVDLHENFSRTEEHQVGSPTSFGYVMAGAFAFFALLPLLRGDGVRLWLLVPSVVFLLFALVWPAALQPFNRAWFWFGMLLNKIMTPLILLLLFFFAVLPTAILMRMTGRDPLRRKLDPTVPTYWITRAPAAGSDSLRKQF